MQPETPVDPELGKPLTLRNLFTHHDAHPVVLDMAMMRRYQLDWLKWEPETIWTAINQDFNTSISEHSRAKIRAIQTLHLVESPWALWQVFEKVCQALNNNIPNWKVMQVPSLEQLFACVDIMDTLRREPFSQEVKSYMAAAVLNDDVFFVPPPLDFIQTEIAQPFYTCQDCKTRFPALFHDGVCDVCTEKFDPEQGLSMRPKPELLQAGFGKKMELGLTYDPDPVQKRWQEVQGEQAPNFEETAVDVQVAKLWMARDYMNLRRKQLAEQLTALKSWLGAT